MYASPVVFFDEGFFYFGGNKGSGTITNTAKIARLDSVTFEWTQPGVLHTARQSHSVIKIDGMFLVIGGDGSFFKTERCIYENQSMTCTEQEPTLDNYGHFPELFKVDSNYCSGL